MLSSGVAYIDGEYVPVAQAKIPLLDWGFIHSDAVYDVAHVWKGRFFRLDDHIHRFQQSAAKLHLDPGINKEHMVAILTECVRKSGLKDAYVELIVTRGAPAPGSRDPRSCSNRFFAFSIPFVWVVTRDNWNQGLRAARASNRRISMKAVDTRIKNYHWLDFTIGLFEAFERGAETVILADDEGNVAEGPGFNVFCVLPNGIVTPSVNVLEGVTRQTVFELCRSHNLACTAGPLSWTELSFAREIFITSTAGGIMPITWLDGKPVSDGRPGPVTIRLDELYWKLHEDPEYCLKVDYR